MRQLILLLAATVAAAACGLMVSTTSNASISCENVPSAACSEQVDALTAGLGNVVDVAIKCADAPPCTRAGGHGSAAIRLANGQKIDRAWSYVGDPGPVPIPQCVGLAQPLCVSYGMSEVDNVSPSKHVVAVLATCSSATCTDASGELKVRITLGDGSQQESTTSWTSN